MRLIVEVCNAHNLMPKDGEGTSSPYVYLDFDGQKQRTRTKSKDLHPKWNEKFEFSVRDPSETLKINVYNDSSGAGRSKFLGRLKISRSSIVKQGQEALIYYPLQKRSIFSHIKGELGLKVYYVHGHEPDGDQSSAKQIAAEPPSTGDDGNSEDKQRQGVPPPPQEEISAGKKPCREDTTNLAELPRSENRPRMEANPTDIEPIPVIEDLNCASALGDRRGAYDLVEQMQYLYVKIVRAKDLNGRRVAGSYVKVRVGAHEFRTRGMLKNANLEWNEVFAIGEDKFDAPSFHITLWDEQTGKELHDFLGGVSFDLQEIPRRVPPDSSLAPQWYRLEDIDGKFNVKGAVMLVAWIGTQADEAFTEATTCSPSDEVADRRWFLSQTRSKIYVSPKLWYLSVNVIEADDLILLGSQSWRYPDISVQVDLGFQSFKTRASINRSSRPFWNEETVFVAAEPFDEFLVLTVEDRGEALGSVHVSLNSIQRRPDDGQNVDSRWFDLEQKAKGRIHVRLCFEGGYHVSDEAEHLASDLRPSLKRLWRRPVGTLDVGILGATDLVPTKTRVDGIGSANAYCVAKYGPKWVRSRTVVDSLNPRWNEQYSWEVYDPCTLFTLGVFHNSFQKSTDLCMGMLRIRISTLARGRIYRNSHPLLVLHSDGLKQMGQLELAVRFSCSDSLIDVLKLYARPPLPKMHYAHPLGTAQQNLLRQSAAKIVAFRLSRSEPPLKRELVQDVLHSDATSQWSMRRSRANWFRIMRVISGVTGFLKWMNDVCQWKSPVTTVLVHVLLVVLVCYPDLVLPTIFLSMFSIGAWRYRVRRPMPCHVDSHLSCADMVSSDELDEEFDSSNDNNNIEIVRMRYDRLRSVAGRIQTLLGDIASQAERVQVLLTWRDPRATAIFMVFCLLAAVLLYVTPFQVIALLLGFYFLRHPRFRVPLPPAPLNFFSRLPAFSDIIL